MESNPPDADVLARSLKEPRAFEVLFDRHFDAVHRYLHRRAGRDIADELAAETFALAFERRAGCRSTGSVLPWLYGIATNLLRRSRRIERRQLSAYARSGVNDWIAYQGETAARLEDSFNGVQLARALAIMWPRERDARLLCALADLSYDEIAAALHRGARRAGLPTRSSTGGRMKRLIFDCVREQGGDTLRYRRFFESGAVLGDDQGAGEARSSRSAMLSPPDSRSIPSV